MFECGEFSNNTDYVLVLLYYCIIITERKEIGRRYRFDYVPTGSPLVQMFPGICRCIVNIYIYLDVLTVDSVWHLLLLFIKGGHPLFIP
jgi:hypothetical protein